MKPHLIAFNGTWICFGGNAAGRAATARMAYERWFMNRIFA